MINRNGVSKKRGRRVSAGGGASGLFTWRPARQNSPPSRGTNRPNGGLFHATTATNPICAGAGSGERRDETKKRTFNTPAPTQHHRAAPPFFRSCSSAHARTPRQLPFQPEHSDTLERSFVRFFGYVFFVTLGCAPPSPPPSRWRWRAPRSTIRGYTERSTATMSRRPSPFFLSHTDEGSAPKACTTRLVCWALSASECWSPPPAGLC